MKNSDQNSKQTVTRRLFIGGGLATGGVVALGGSVSLLGSTQLSSAAAVHPTYSQMTLTEHLCTVMHKYASDKLTRIVADPTISKEETSLALRTTRCPYCDTSISASYPVVPLVSAA